RMRSTRCRSPTAPRSSSPRGPTTPPRAAPWAESSRTALDRPRAGGPGSSEQGVEARGDAGRVQTLGGEDRVALRVGDELEVDAEAVHGGPGCARRGPAGEPHRERRADPALGQPVLEGEDRAGSGGEV